MRYSVFVFLFLIFQTGCRLSTTQDPHEQFRGLWKLYRIDIGEDNGNWKEYHWNKGGDSYILYDGRGHMSVHFTPAGYSGRKVKAPEIPLDSLSADDLRADLKTYMSSYAYTAKCTILEEERIIEHYRLSHTYPKEWGVKVQRKYDFQGDTLILITLEREKPLRLKWIKQP